MTDKECRAVSRLFSAAIDSGQPELADDIGDWIASLCDGREGFSWGMYQEYAACLGLLAADILIAADN